MAYDTSKILRDPKGRFSGFAGTPQDGTLTDSTIPSNTVVDGPGVDGTVTDGSVVDGTVTDGTVQYSTASIDDVRGLIASRAEQLSMLGFVPAAGLKATLGDPRYAGDQEDRATWWGAEKSLAEFGRPSGDYRQMPDNYTPSSTGGQGTEGLRRTHRMHYEGAGVSLRMPSAASIRRFEAEFPGKSIVVPVTARTPHGDVTGWVRLTRGSGNRWAASAGGFGSDGDGVERAADMAEAVSCVLEARAVTGALRSAGDLSARRAAREAEAGVVEHSVRSAFVKSVGVNREAGLITLTIRDTTYGYQASDREITDFMETSKSEGVGKAFNAVVRNRVVRVPVEQCVKCGCKTAPHLTHRCRITAVSGGARVGGYEGVARVQAARFADAVRTTVPAN